MSITRPDLWIIVSVSTEAHGRIDKVVGSWYGGYGGSDSWKMSSGITEVVDQGDHYAVHNYSGSVYKCYKKSEGASSYTSMVIENYREKLAELKDGSSLRIIKIEEVKPIKIGEGNGDT